MPQTSLSAHDLAEQAEAFGARLQVACRHARLKPSDLWKRLSSDFNIKLARSSVYAAYNGKVSRPRYTREYAEITRVNQIWLETGQGKMFDVSGRKTNAERAAQDVRSILQQHVIPPLRNDLLRILDRLVDKIGKRELDHQKAQLLNNFLDSLTEPEPTKTNIHAYRHQENR